MTALDVITRVEGRLHSVFSREDKLRWLGQVEGLARGLQARCGADGGAGELTLDTVLSVPAPFDVLYDRWLEAQIDFANQEYLKYNNAMAVFQTFWQEYANHLRRTAPAVGRRQFF